MGKIKSEYPTEIFAARNKPSVKEEITIYLVYYVSW